MTEAERSPCKEWTLFQGDAFHFLRALAKDSVDLVVTDPPYESLEKHRKVGTTTRLKKSKASSNDWFPVMPNERFGELFTELYRVMKRNSHLYLFCDWETLRIAAAAGEGAGFKLWKPLIWDKCHIGMGYHYRARHEFILFFEKGKRKLRDLAVPDVLSVPRVAPTYPTQKPVELIKTLVLQSSCFHEIVCDPFAGSGSTGVAALNLGRRFVGCDVQDRAIKLSTERLKRAQNE